MGEEAGTTVTASGEQNSIKLGRGEGMGEVGKAVSVGGGKVASVALASVGEEDGVKTRLA
jgi:hypothetical protein